MPATSICLVRHGETDWNAERRVQGQLDIPLNDRGHVQAQAVVNVLRQSRQCRFDKIYSSDLLRALQTAASAIP